MTMTALLDFALPGAFLYKTYCSVLCTAFCRDGNVGVGLGLDSGD
jgi:hypothetical protein